MADLDREKIKMWILGFAVLTAVFVGVLSWSGGVLFPQLLLRIGMAFTVMFGLGMGGLILFEQGGVKETSGNGRAKGSLIDIAVGEGEQASTLQEDAVAEAAEPNAQRGRNSRMSREEAENLPGQVKPSLHKGLPDSEAQADIVRRMGWGE